jgi:hypothetical protein
VEHLKGASLGLAPALPANARRGWKGFPGTNTLAYYGYMQMSSIKSFIAQGPEANGKVNAKLPYIYVLQNKNTTVITEEWRYQIPQ